MSQSIRVTFPGAARANTVATALAIAAGAPYDIQEANSVHYAHVPGLQVKAVVGDPYQSRIEFLGASGEQFTANYHYEFGTQGNRGLLLPFKPVCMALAVAVVRQLGGRVSVESIAGDDVEVFNAPSRWCPAQDADAAFQEIQRLVRETPPVTPLDVGRAARMLYV